MRDFSIKRFGLLWLTLILAITLRAETYDLTPEQAHCIIEACGADRGDHDGGGHATTSEPMTWLLVASGIGVLTMAAARRKGTEGK